MIKKSVFAKSVLTLFTTTLVVGAITFSEERFEAKRVDLSAFKNVAANIQYLSQKKQTNEDLMAPDVASGIVQTIEKEIKGKIRKTRISLQPKPVQKTIEVKEIVAKNWNDIKPEFQSSSEKSYLKEIKNESLLENLVSSDSFEINNSELIKLYAFEIENHQYESFNNVEIASLEIPVDDTKVDVINTTQAASVSEEKTINDDLVMYDYSTVDVKEDEVIEEKALVTDSPAKPIEKKIFDVPLSKSVEEAIKREVGHSPKRALAMNTQKQTEKRKETLESESDLEKVMENEDNLIFDYSQEKMASTVKKTENQESSAFVASGKNDAIQADFTLRAVEIDMNTQKTRQSFGFEFVPDYDRAERMDDQTTGEIKIGYSPSGEVNTQTGVVQSQGMIPTRVELNLLNIGMNIPLINEVSIQQFLEKKKLDIVGNLLMVAIDPSILDVEIDSEYQAKLYLNKSFKEVQNSSQASYMLFLGVRTGNVLSRYLLANKETAQKIIYVGDGEMYYEDPDFMTTQRELYTFTTRSLLGKKVKELNIDGENVSIFGTKTKSKKKAINAYEIKVPERVAYSRKYLEFKHLGHSLFVGTEDKNEIEIPGNDFIGKVLDAQNISELAQRCMVQINLEKEVREIKASGKNKQGEMFVEMSYLDNDGGFSMDTPELAEKIFVTGDQEGQFSIRLDYTDGSTDFLKTFCSEGSYVVEQL